MSKTFTPPTLAEAKRKYGNRFTMEHAPEWAKVPAPNGKYYAPQYESDAEWYANTRFPGSPFHIMGTHHGGNCDSRNQTFPLGQWLDSPYTPKSV